MTQQFHEGQEVEVWKTVRRPGADYTGQRWCKAKIVYRVGPGAPAGEGPDEYMTQFHDGTSGMFDATHIRAIENKPYAAMARSPHAKGFGGLEI